MANKNFEWKQVELINGEKEIESLAENSLNFNVTVPVTLSWRLDLFLGQRSCE